MEIDNTSRLTAGCTLGVDPDGQEYIVLAAKGSYVIPAEDGAVCKLAGSNDLLNTSDEFWGEPGFSAQRYEVDYALHKPRCDVLLNGTAYAPEGRPIERLQVGIQIGSWNKRIDIVGDRVWTEGLSAPTPSSPNPFIRMPITYDRAFGGTDKLDPDDETPSAFLPNPSGLGWHRVRNQSRIGGAPLPNTEEPGHPVRSPWGEYRPMSFGPVARGWPQRLKYAGTYDQNWTDNVFPFLPEDFDRRYYQAAPEDQQIDYLQGGETILLVNLTPEGRTQFRLPKLDLPLVFMKRLGQEFPATPVVDTIMIEPDRRLVHLTWRASLSLETDIFEVPEAILGYRSKSWWRARRLGKTYYPSLKSLVAAKSDADA